MNTREQAIIVKNKISELIDFNKGEFTITFFDETNIKIKLISMTTTLTGDGFTCYIDTFTNDIYNPTRYDIFEIKNVN